MACLRHCYKIIWEAMIFGIKVRELREALGMSQGELAKAAGCSQPVIVKIESGEQKTSRKLPGIARALGVDIAELDPDYPTGTIRTLSFDHAAAAYGVMLEFLRPDFDSDARQALARLFLELAQVRLVDKVGGDLADQMRLRVEFLIEPYRQK